MTFDKILALLIKFLFAFLVFSVPLIFLPGHVELFQFNKMMTVYLATVILASAWFIRMIWNRKIIIRRTPLDIPILIFFSSQLISTIFSIEPHTSIWGYYSRFHGGFLSTVSYLLLYYVLVSYYFSSGKNRTDRDDRLVNLTSASLLLSATIVALYGILEHFGIDAHYWVQDVRNRIFSTLGQPNWLAAFITGISSLVLAFLTTGQQKYRKKEGLHLLKYLTLFAVFFTTILFTKSRSGILAFALMYAVFWSLYYLFWKKTKSIKSISKKADSVSHHFMLKKTFYSATLILAVLSLLIGTPYTPNLQQALNKLSSRKIAAPVEPINQPAVQQEIGGTESGKIRKIVWKGAVDIWRNWPIFGSGVETFAYSYYNFRPIEHNYISEWDFLYNKAHNEYLNYLATTGAFGLGSYLLLQVWYIIWTLLSVKNIEAKQKNSQVLLSYPSSLLIALLAGYLGISLALFFGFSTVTDGLLLFIYPALAVRIANGNGWRKLQFISNKKTARKSTRVLQIILTILVIGLSLNTSFQLVKRWYADRLFAKGQYLSKQNQISEALVLEQRASALVPDEPLFHDRLSLDLARSAAALFQNGEVQTAQLFAKTAKAHSDLAFLQNPVHINYLKNRAATMLHLTVVDEKYKQDALQVLKQAQKLSPTDPKLPYNIGLFYLQENQTEKAIRFFAKTLELKHDYTEAHLSLAATYKKLDQNQKSREQYEYILKNIDPKNTQALEALEILEK